MLVPHPSDCLNLTYLLLSSGFLLRHYEIHRASVQTSIPVSSTRAGITYEIIAHLTFASARCIRRNDGCASTKSQRLGSCCPLHTINNKDLEIGRAHV